MRYVFKCQITMYGVNSLCECIGAGNLSVWNVTAALTDSNINETDSNGAGGDLMKLQHFSHSEFRWRIMLFSSSRSR